MDLRREIKFIVGFILFYAFFYLFPYPERILQGLKEGVLLLSWYAREHVLYCLVPAFFIAGAISTFISKESVLKYLGPDSPKVFAFLVASVAGTVLAVCSCTVLPLFAGLYLQGAGIGPATTFLYSGPAINVLAIVLSAKVLGLDIGIARALGSISMGILIGILMHFIFREFEKQRLSGFQGFQAEKGLSFEKSVFFLATLVAILLIATSNLPYKWPLLYLFYLLLLVEMKGFFNMSFKNLAFSAIIVLALAIFQPYKEIPFIAGVILVSYLANKEKGILGEWFDNSYILAKQIFPLLFIGVFVSGFFLGGIEGEGYIPKRFIEALLGGTGFFTHLLSAVITALMYFATLTEVPIIQGLMAQGVKEGPALAMLLAGPAVSLPSLLVLRAIMGTKRTLTYAILVIIISAFYGYLYQILFT
ncbi:MAG: permease [Caldimicrobium sp.]